MRSLILTGDLIRALLERRSADAAACWKRALRPSAGSAPARRPRARPRGRANTARPQPARSRRASAQRRAPAPGHARDVGGVAERARDAVGDREEAGTLRATTTGRPQASASIAASPKPSRSETRHATSAARSQRGTSAGSRIPRSARCRRCPDRPQEPPGCCARPVADQRERATTPLGAGSREGRQRRGTFLRGMSVPT